LIENDERSHFFSFRYHKAILIVGYGRTKTRNGNPINYWIAQNSWGSDWGDGGYFKIVQGKGICRIVSDAWMPVVKSPQVKSIKSISVPYFCSHVKDVVDLRTIGVKKTFCVVELVVLSAKH
jgi:hypothetical protein